VKSLMSGNVCRNDGQFRHTDVNFEKVPKAVSQSNAHFFHSDLMLVVIFVRAQLGPLFGFDRDFDITNIIICGKEVSFLQGRL